MVETNDPKLRIISNKGDFASESIQGEPRANAIRGGTLVEVDHRFGGDTHDSNFLYIHEILNMLPESFESNLSMLIANLDASVQRVYARDPADAMTNRRLLGPNELSRTPNFETKPRIQIVLKHLDENDGSIAIDGPMAHYFPTSSELYRFLEASFNVKWRPDRWFCKVWPCCMTNQIRKYVEIYKAQVVDLLRQTYLRTDNYLLGEPSGRRSRLRLGDQSLWKNPQFVYNYKDYYEKQDLLYELDMIDDEEPPSPIEAARATTF